MANMMASARPWQTPSEFISTFMVLANLLIRYYTQKVGQTGIRDLDSNNLGSCKYTAGTNMMPPR